MSNPNNDFAEVVKFHGHACPGLAFGFRATRLALEQLGISRAGDEELVAVVENKSCAVDAIQALAGCTFGKGNLIFKDYGKQVYTLFNRSSGEAVRLAVIPRKATRPERRGRASGPESARRRSWHWWKAPKSPSSKQSSPPPTGSCSRSPLRDSIRRPRPKFTGA